MEMRIKPFLNSHEYALELDEFWPKEGYKEFLTNFCVSIGGDFIDWRQGVESGLGHIYFEKEKLTVYWSDFPDAFSFDCNSQMQAERLKGLVRSYLVENNYLRT